MSGITRQPVTRFIRPEFVPALVSVVVVLLVAAIVRPAFYSGSNLRTVAYLFSFLSVVSLGQLLVIIVGGIDLSVGAVMSASLIMLVQIAGRPGDSVAVGLLGVFTIAVAVGIVNGLLVAVRQVPAILATLATLVLLNGSVLYLTEGRSSGRVPEAIVSLGAGRVAGVPVPFIIAVALAASVAFALRRTAYGRVLYATGANREASRYAGVSVRLVTASAFVIGSLLAMFAGLLLAGFVGFPDRTIGNGYDLTSITAVVLGGAVLGGGRGTVVGTMIAAVALASLENLLLLLGFDVAYQLMIKAAVLLLAVGAPIVTRAIQTRRASQPAPTRVSTVAH